MTTERIDPPLVGNERIMLRTFLDYHRATLAMKCDGLTDEALRCQSMPPSSLSLLGLVRHMAEVERNWFRRVINGEDIPLVWSETGVVGERRLPGGLRREHGHVGGGVRRVADGDRALSPHRGSRGVTRPGQAQRTLDEDLSLRLVILHLIHEYARHNGHADLLREGIDGSVGV